MKIFYSLTLLSALIIMASSESQAIDKNTVGLWTFESGKGQTSQPDEASGADKGH